MKTRPIKLIAALALALMLSLSCLTAAFAAGDPIYGTQEAPAKAAITKILKMPEGTNAPNANFVFNVKSVTANGAAADGTNMPVLGTQVDNKNGTFTLNAISDHKPSSSSTNSTITLRVLESADIFAGKSFAAGIYVYEITENPNTYTIADAKHESMVEVLRRVMDAAEPS